MAEYANPDALVEIEWLEGHLDDPSIRVIEVDEDTTAYEKGHIQGAVGWNWSTDLHAPVGREYVDQAALAALLQRAGVGPDTTVVLYGANNNWFAAYAYWLLRYLGFGNVKLLNGGRKKWELESRSLTMDVPSYATTDLTITEPVNGGIRAFRDEVLGEVKKGGGAFVDVRSPEEYRGDKRASAHPPQARAQGTRHIPGAATSPWGKAAR